MNLRLHHFGGRTTRASVPGTTPIVSPPRAVVPENPNPSTTPNPCRDVVGEPGVALDGATPGTFLTPLPSGCTNADSKLAVQRSWCHNITGDIRPIELIDAALREFDLGNPPRALVYVEHIRVLRRRRDAL